MAIKFISYKDSKYFDETQTIHLKIDNTEIMMVNETDEIIEKLFESYLQKYQERLEDSKKGSDLIF